MAESPLHMYTSTSQALNRRETILITGACGFLGYSLACAFLSSINEEEESPRLILVDITEPQIPLKGAKEGDNVISLKVDLTSRIEVETLFTTSLGTPHTIYCMHGIMGSGSEENFDLGIKVNVDSIRFVLEAARKYGSVQKNLIKFIYTSSIAVYGGPLPETVTMDTVPWPQGAYGTAKLMSEAIVNEYSRRGFVDARILRLPGIVVRHMAPHVTAASSFLSDIIRDPLHGVPTTCPIGTSLESPILDSLHEWIASPQTTTKNLIHARRIPADVFPSHTRVVCLPGFRVSIREELDALKDVGGEDALKLVQFKEKENPLIVRLLQSWPSRFDISYPLSLGFIVDEGGILPIVRKFANDFNLGKWAKSKSNKDLELSARL